MSLYKILRGRKPSKAEKAFPLLRGDITTSELPLRPEATLGAFKLVS